MTTPPRPGQAAARITSANGATSTTAVNLMGTGLSGVWVGPTSAQVLTLMHAPYSLTEPAASAFKAMDDHLGSPIQIALHADCATEQRFVSFGELLGHVQHLYWFRLDLDVAETEPSTEWELAPRSYS